MKDLLKHEIYKLFKSKTAWILAAVVGGLAFLNVLIVFAGQELLADFGISAAGYQNAATAYVDIQSAGIAAAIIAALLISYETNHRTLGQAVIAGKTRLQIYAAKYLTVILYVCVLTASLFIINAALSAVLFDWGKTVTFGNLLMDLAVPLVMTLVLSCAFAAFITFFAFLTASTAVVIIIPVALLFVLSLLDALLFYLGVDGFYLFNTIIYQFWSYPTFLNFLIYFFWVVLFAAPFGYFGFKVFEKKEIK